MSTEGAPGQTGAAGDGTGGGAGGAGGAGGTGGEGEHGGKGGSGGEGGAGAPGTPTEPLTRHRRIDAWIDRNLGLSLTVLLAVVLAIAFTVGTLVLDHNNDRQFDRIHAANVASCERTNRRLAKLDGAMHRVFDKDADTPEERAELATFDDALKPEDCSRAYP